MKMTLFICSHLLSADREALHLAYDYHYYWQGRNYHHIYTGFMADIYSRGRILEKPSLEVLDALARKDLSGLEIKVVDTGDWRGWLTAAWHRVRAPAMLIDLETFIGSEACLKKLQDYPQKQGEK